MLLSNESSELPLAFLNCLLILLTHFRIALPHACAILFPIMNNQSTKIHPNINIKFTADYAIPVERNAGEDRRKFNRWEEDNEITSRLSCAFRTNPLTTPYKKLSGRPESSSRRAIWALWKISVAYILFTLTATIVRSLNTEREIV